MINRLKTFEEMKTVNSKDLKNWSVKNIGKAPKSEQTVIIKKDLTDKILDLFEEYGLGIYDISRGDFLNDSGLLLPGEEKYDEYRVTLGRKIKEDDISDLYGYDNYDDLDDDDKKDFDERVGKVEDIEEKLEFSVFLSSGIQSHNIESAALVQASKYLITLNTIPMVYSGAVGEYMGPFSDNIGNFKNFINVHNIKITNDNLELVEQISHRLYKDSKFFARLKEQINDIRMKDLLNRWFLLIKNKLV